MTNYTQALFEKIQNLIGKNVKLAKPIADLLSITENAAYRKIKGESSLTIEEYFLIANHYKIDIHNINNVEGEFLFKGNLVYNDNKYVQNYFEDSKKLLEMITAQNGKLHNLSKDIPLFYYFYYKELGWFKIYFMLKFILLDPAYQDKKFSLQNIDEKLIAIAKSYTEQYQEVNTCETWNLESVNTTLHQLEFACTNGILKEQTIISSIFSQLKKMIFVVEQQCKTGFKFDYAKQIHPKKSSFELYHNNLYLAHNSYYLETLNNNYAFVSFGVFNYIYTENQHFTNYTKNHFENIKHQSISLNENKKERDLFFEKLELKIDAIYSKCISSIAVEY